MKEISCNKTKDKVLQVLCPQCDRETRHSVLQSVDVDGHEENRDEGWWYSWTSGYQVIQCQGCEFISFRSEASNSEDQDPVTGEYYITERVYPLRSKGTLANKDYLNVPFHVRGIHREVIDAFNAELKTLCAAGLRSVIESICTQEGVTAGPVAVTNSGVTKIVQKKNLEGKIAGLHEKGILTKKNATALLQLRFLGNEALHELTQPSREELLLGIQIVGHMLDEIYEVPVKAEELRAKATTRKKRRSIF